MARGRRPGAADRRQSGDGVRSACFFGPAASPVADASRTSRAAAHLGRLGNLSVRRSLSTAPAENPLHAALRQNRATLRAVTALLERDSSWARAPDAHGRLPLHVATLYRARTVIAERVLYAYPDAASCADDRGDLPLHLAIGTGNASHPPHSSGSLEVIRLLVDANGKGAMHANADGLLPLHLALARSAGAGVVDLLLERGPQAISRRTPDGRLPLQLAVTAGAGGDVLQSLLGKHHSAASEVVFPTPADCATLLRVAIACRAPVSVVESLLARHPSVARERDKSGRLPLHAAATSHASIEVVEALLKVHPTAPEAIDEMGFMPLHYALQTAAGEDVARRVLLAFPEAARHQPGGHPEPLLMALQARAPAGTIRALALTHLPAARTAHHGLLPLHLACRMGSPAGTVPALLEAHPEGAATAVPSTGQLPLHIAAASTDCPLDAVLALLEAFPAATTHEDWQGRLPIHLAAAQAKASVKTVTALLRADPQTALQRDNKGCLPVQLAIEQKAPAEVIQDLTEATELGPAFGEDVSTLHIALGHQATAPVVRAILSSTSTQGASELDRHNRLPLHYAVENCCSLEAVTALLEAYPAAVAQADTDGATPLHIAVTARSPHRVIAALVAAGPEAASAADAKGRVPLHLAAAGQTHVDVVRALLDGNRQAAGFVDGDGQLPLHLALESRASASVIKELVLSHQGALAAEAQNGQLPLHMAVEHCCPAEITIFLLRQHPDASMHRDASGCLPLDLALQNLNQGLSRLSSRRSSTRSLGGGDSHGGLKTSRATLAQEVCRELLLAAPGAMLRVKEHNHLALQRTVSHLADGSLKAALKAQPQVVLETAEDGRMLLHVAAMCGFRGSDASTVLKVAPSAARAVDNAGCLPLHYAAQHQAPPEVVRHLLTAHPRALCKAIAFPALHAAVLGDMVAQHGHLAELRGPEGESWVELSDPEVRRAVKRAKLYMGRYTVERSVPAYYTRNSVVAFAIDSQAEGADRQVVLKLMRDAQDFIRELQVRSCPDLYDGAVTEVFDAFVEGDASFLPPDITRAVSVHTEPCVGGRAPIKLPDEQSRSLKYCLAIRRGQWDLDLAMRHVSTFMGHITPGVREICHDLACLLWKLHASRYVHGNFTPRNLVQVGEDWQLIDMETSGRCGSPFMAKRPSTGYCPPEMACDLLSTAADRSASRGIAGFSASVTADMWSYGLVVYQIVSGRSMWHCNHNCDIVDPRDLKLLSEWSAETRDQKLDEGGLQRGTPLRDLLDQLLDPSEDQRMRSFPSGMLDVLNHSFFASETEDTFEDGLHQYAMEPDLPTTLPAASPTPSSTRAGSARKAAQKAARWSPVPKLRLARLSKDDHMPPRTPSSHVKTSSRSTLSTEESSADTAFGGTEISLLPLL